MCTLTVIERVGSARSFRVVMSRDESWERASAAPPRWHRLASGLRAIWPVDMQAGGTWVAGGEHGLVLCLMNLNLEPPAVLPAGLRSRGLVIPELIGNPGAEAAIAALGRMRLEEFAPFRMAAVELGVGGRAMRVIEGRWDRRELRVLPHGAGPICMVSSGLGDSRALPRIGLFQELVADDGATPAVQDRFHRHRWEDRPEISVLMAREEARTVSITAVEVEEAGARIGGMGAPRANGSVNGHANGRPAGDASATVRMHYEPVGDAPARAIIRARAGATVRLAAGPGGI